MTRRSVLIQLAVTLLFISSCTSTTVTRAWKDETYLYLPKERQCDFVILTLFRGKKTVGATESGKGASTAPQDFSALWRDYYLHGYTLMPARSQVREIYSVETDLYETGEERPIWKSGGDLIVNGPVADQYERFVELLVGKLRADKIIR